MTELSQEARSIRSNDWKQGSLIEIDGSIGENNSRGKIESGLYLVVSQDCDIQTHPLEVEPFIEIICCKKIEKLHGNFTNGKNPRKLHLPFKQGTDDNDFELDINNRYFLDRAHLTTLKPYGAIDSKHIKNVRNWLIKRYNRAAFPDNFNSRLDRKALKKIIENSHDNIQYICVGLDTYEDIAHTEIYNISFYLLVKDTISDTDFDDLTNLLNKLIEECEKNRDITVIDSEVRRSNEITLTEFFNLRQLDFDHLSNQD